MLLRWVRYYNDLLVLYYGTSYLIVTNQVAPMYSNHKHCAEEEIPAYPLETYLPLFMLAWYH